MVKGKKVECYGRVFNITGLPEENGPFISIDTKSRDVVVNKKCVLSDNFHEDLNGTPLKEDILNAAVVYMYISYTV